MEAPFTNAVFYLWPETEAFSRAQKPTEAYPLPTTNNLPCKRQRAFQNWEVKESDVIPSEQPELKVTVTRLPSIILTIFIKTKAAFDAFNAQPLQQRIRY